MGGFLEGLSVVLICPWIFLCEVPPFPLSFFALSEVGFEEYLCLTNKAVFSMYYLPIYGRESKGYFESQIATIAFNLSW